MLPPPPPAQSTPPTIASQPHCLLHDLCVCAEYPPPSPQIHVCMLGRGVVPGHLALLPRRLSPISVTVAAPLLIMPTLVGSAKY